MAVRGVYTDAEKEMLAIFDKDAERLSGWYKPLNTRVASEESMKTWASVVDPWNPLWRDESYAANTRWGGIIALPMYEERFSFESWQPTVPPGAGFIGGYWWGENWEFFKPIRPNDHFRVWRRRSTLDDITSLDGKGVRTFGFVSNDADLINQKEELVSVFKSYLEIPIFPEPPKRKADPFPDYSYTEEELAFIDRTFKAEEIRGAKIRYWEDVKVGEELKPVVMGPTTLWDAMMYTFGRGEGEYLPMMEIRKKMPFMVRRDPASNITHHGLEFHHSDPGAHLSGMPHAILYGVISRQLMVRCVTNWMGDDGFLRKLHWRHMAANYIGDTMISYGRVVNKSVEDGEYLVDISLWPENMRGYMQVIGRAIVSLPSKENPRKWK
jgi:acyl dehydratase